MKYQNISDDHPLLRAKPILSSIPLPPQPEVLRKVFDEYRQPTPDLQHIAGLVSSDVSLSGAVLQAVNSPLFGLRHTVTAIPQAIGLLGLRRVLLLVRAVALRNSFGRDAECERFWDSANTMANISYIMAERLGLVDKDDLYTVGLFHDCGMLLMLKQFSDYKALLTQANNDTSRPVTEWEDERYGLNHTDLGFLISVSWFLPPALCHAVAVHHKPFANMINGKRRIVDGALTLLAAHKAAHHIFSRYRQQRRGDREDPLWLQESAAVLAQLGLSEPDFLAARDQLLDDLEGILHGAG